VLASRIGVHAYKADALDYPRVRPHAAASQAARLALVAVPAGGYADLVLGDLADEAVLVGDPAGPATLEPVLQRHHR
jgi:hypothetical protein